MPVLGAVCPYSKTTESLTVGHRITYKLCLTTWKLLAAFLSGLFCVCTFYLELSACTLSFYRQAIHL